MKKILTLILAATMLMAVSEPSFAQKKKKKGKGKVTVHGEKDNDAKFNERKNKGSDGPPGSSKKKKGKKSKKDTSFAPRPTEFDLFYTAVRKEEENSKA